MATLKCNCRITRVARCNMASHFLHCDPRYLVPEMEKLAEANAAL